MYLNLEPNKYAICRLDRVSGTPDGRLKAAVDIQNGMFVIQNEVDKQLELATDSTQNVVLVASVAHMHDSQNEGDFINKAGGVNPRTYQLEEGDIFTITDKAISFAGTNARGDFDAIKVGDKGFISEVDAGKLAFVAAGSEPDDAKLVVEVIDKTKLNRDNAVQLKVVRN